MYMFAANYRYIKCNRPERCILQEDLSSLWKYALLGVVVISVVSMYRQRGMKIVWYCGSPHAVVVARTRSIFRSRCSASVESVR